MSSLKTFLGNAIIPKPAGGDANAVDLKIVNPKNIKPAEAKPNPKEAYNLNNILKVIRHQETRGQLSPYRFVRFSGDDKQGNANGAYQVTDGELKTYAKRYLGRQVNSDEFLKNPKLQDQYMSNKISDWINRYKMDLPNIFVSHRGGINARIPDYQQYVDEAVNLYNS